MGRKQEARKYGAPLYCAAWPEGDYALVAGGGGKKSSGISNRLVTVQHTGAGQLSAEVGSVEIEDAPLRMALSPGALVLALAKGGLQRFDLQRNNPEGPPALTPPPAKAAERLAALGVVKALAFSRDGRLLALGGEDGSLVVLDWLTLHARRELRGELGLREAVRDLDFSPAHKDKVLATTCEGGSCVLWAWEKGLQIAVLELPAGLEGGSFSRCRFARDGSTTLYTAVNRRGEGHICQWDQTEEGELLLRRRVRADTSPLTAFDISRRGSYLGVGTSEGDAAAFSTASLARVARARAAHMVFTTALAFDAQEEALLSVSADASARVTPLPKARPKPPAGRLLSWGPLLLLAALLLACAAVAAWMLALDEEAARLLGRRGIGAGRNLLKSHPEL